MGYSHCITQFDRFVSANYTQSSNSSKISSSQLKALDFFLFSKCCRGKEKVEIYRHHQGGEISLSLQTLHDEVELIAQGLKAIRHSDLGHVGLTDVVAFWTFLQIVLTQEVGFFLEHRIKPMIFFFLFLNKPIHPSIFTSWEVTDCLAQE